MHIGLLAITLVFLGVFSRLIPHAPNIAAIGALMLFGGYELIQRFSKKYLPRRLFQLLY